MNAELYGSSHPSDGEPAARVSFDDAPAEARTEMENSVLDALRPLLRTKRRKNRDQRNAHEQGGSHVLPASGSAPQDIDAQDGGPSEDADAAQPADDLAANDETGFEDEFETFTAIGEDLERRSRQSATMVRMLEQHRQLLVTAERERDAAYDKLARVVPVVQETAQELREAMAARKVDDDPARMHRLFMLNGRALDELEKVATTLFADYLWVKSAWEQYARSVEDARKLRSTFEG